MTAVRDRLYQEAKTDPTLLRLLVERPELVVETKRQTISTNGEGALGWTARLIAEGYFDTQRSVPETWKELKRRGYAGISARIYESTDSLHKKGFLTKESDGFLAVPGMKINIIEG